MVQEWHGILYLDKDLASLDGQKQSRACNETFNFNFIPNGWTS